MPVADFDALINFIFSVLSFSAVYTTALRVQRATPRLRDVEPFAKPGARELTVLVMFSEAVRPLHIVVINL